MKTTKEKIEVMQAFVDGKTVEVGRRSIRKGLEWIELPQSEEPFWHWQDSDYRIKPEPELRPWKPEEVPVGALLRSTQLLATLILNVFKDKTTGYYCLGFSAYSSFKDCCVSRYMFLGDLVTSIEKFEHSTDHGKTWLPCGVVE